MPAAVAVGQEDRSVDESSGGRPTVASLFEDFLHYSVLGRFDIADSVAERLLSHPDLNPLELLALSEKNERSVETLLILVDHSTLGVRAARVLEVIREGEHLQRKETDRILLNIEKLGGPPQTEYNAIERLVESGEYAVPWLLLTLRDEAKSSLWPRIVRALPQLGKGGLNPLVESLATTDGKLRQTIVSALGEIGYPQSYPYLLSLLQDGSSSAELKASVVDALELIARRSGRRFTLDTADAFVRLAEGFYDEHDAYRADVRLGQANVWYWDGGHQFVEPVGVPREIFGSVMAMRCCERALQADPQREEAISLWLAANIRRESRLGYNVESGDVTEAAGVDPTRPDAFPRAVYFTSAAGARHARRVLERALNDFDASVALGAIAALRQTAGPSSLVLEDGTGASFSDALKFPDTVVRIRAALAAGAALPRAIFRGSETVVPTLGEALTLTGRANVLVVGKDEDDANRIAAQLRDADTQVISATQALAGLDRADSEFVTLQAIVLSTSIRQPVVADAVGAVRSRYDHLLTPIILVVEPGESVVAEPLARGDSGVSMVEAGASREVLLRRVAETSARVGRTPVTDEFAHELALLAADVLHQIALDGDTALDALGAERALISTLDASREDLQIAAAGVLGLIQSAGAQDALATASLRGSYTESFRLAAMAGLSESARRFGNHLSVDQVEALQELVFEETNLRLRTAGSYALGALNIAADRASRIPLKYSRE